MERVLQIDRLDESSDSVLLHVNRVNESSIDSQILATDGNAPYFVSIKEQEVTDFRDEKHCGEAEWITALSTVFFGQCSTTTTSDNKGIEIVASSVSSDHIVLTIRRKISDIAHRLGSFTLQRDDALEIELFNWAGIAAQSTTRAQKKIEELEKNNASQQETVARLKSQLQELVTAKETHEKQLLEKFRELLNSKKLKIRDQQTLLATARIDNITTAQVQGSRSVVEPRQPQASRISKRKAITEPKPEASDRIDDKRKLDMDEDDENDSLADPNTPEASETEDTEDEGVRAHAEMQGNSVGEDASRLLSIHNHAQSSAVKLPARQAVPLPYKDKAEGAAPADRMDNNEETDDEL